MPKKKTLLDQLTELSRNDLVEWAGYKIVTRGENYQIEGRVSDLVMADDSNLIASVEGTRQYITKVSMNRDELPESICTCPYYVDCKHGVAVVLESLNRLELNKKIPMAEKEDHRLDMIENDEWDDEVEEEEKRNSGIIQQDMDKFLKNQSKAQLIDLIRELAVTYPAIGYDLSSRQQIKSGSTGVMVNRLRKEIRDICNEPDWQDYWDGDEYIPNYSEIHKNLHALLTSGHPDEVVDLGRELMKTIIYQIEQGWDDETVLELDPIIPVITEALELSSLDTVEKLNWALDAVLNDSYELWNDFAEYLNQKHPKEAWNELSDQLLERLKKQKKGKLSDDFNNGYDRDRLSFWTVHALERAGRKKEIIPLCIAEAEITGSYERLVDLLVQEKDFQEAEKWIKKGIRDIGGKWPGTRRSLKNKLRDIRKQQKRWPEVAALRVEEFMEDPAKQSFKDCREACKKARCWTNVRGALLEYLEKGKPPWTRKDWPLPESGLEKPNVKPNHPFPLVDRLIAIAIVEKKPDQVLKWYDRKPKDRFGWYGLDEDTIAKAVANHAPERAVGIWKGMAEKLIAQVKPSAYQKASRYLIKAEKILRREKKIAEWEAYVDFLKKQHFRKTRLIEVLDNLDGKPILLKR